MKFNFTKSNSYGSKYSLQLSKDGSQVVMVSTRMGEVVRDYFPVSSFIELDVTKHWFFGKIEGSDYVIVFDSMSVTLVFGKHVGFQKVSAVAPVSGFKKFIEFVQENGMK